ncbi:unnamed protein product, partial [Rhizoctonia solani]
MHSLGVTPSGFDSTVESRRHQSRLARSTPRLRHHHLADHLPTDDQHPSRERGAMLDSTWVPGYQPRTRRPVVNHDPSGPLDSTAAPTSPPRRPTRQFLNDHSTTAENAAPAPALDSNFVLCHIGSRWTRAHDRAYTIEHSAHSRRIGSIGFTGPCVPTRRLLDGIRYTEVGQSYWYVCQWIDEDLLTLPVSY